MDEQAKMIDQRPQTAGVYLAAEKVGIDELDPDDIVIAVMGPTGSGRGTFVRCTTGREDHGVGHALKSFTNDVVAIKFWDQESEHFVVLGDTPGFDDTSKSDLDILNLISSWLSSSYSKNKLLSGILYFYRITDNRMAGTPLKNLRLFRKLCGDSLDKVYLTTTMWDEVDWNVGQKRLDQLKTEYWKTMIDQGAQVACCRSDDDSAKRLIRQIIAQEGSLKLSLRLEDMAELKKKLGDMTAGQQLHSHLAGLAEKQTSVLLEIKKEMAKLFALRAEYSQLRMQIEDGLREVRT